MDAVYIAAAVPFFFLLIGVELLFSRKASERRYDFGDSITNLSCGIGSQVIGPFFAFLAIGTYSFAFEHYRVASVPSTSAWGFALAMIGVDLCYYLFHRASHRVNLFWAAHVVHHQSEEYNLSVALRQAWFEGPLQWVFYVPLAIAGVPPVLYVTSITLNTLYQFWIHTRAIKTLGPLEWVFNTPSHHRVHHGSNPKYIDKNYGGIFIVWDRLFGTFQREEEEPVYGLVKPLASFNPLWANFAHWERMAELAKAGSAGEALSVWFRPPEWLPAAQGGRASIPEVSRETQRKYGSEVSTSRALRIYVGLHLALVVALTTIYILIEKHLAFVELSAIAAWFVASLVSWGALFERRGWAPALEVARLIALPVLLAWLCHGTPLFFPAVLASVGVGAASALGRLGKA